MPLFSSHLGHPSALFLTVLHFGARYLHQCQSALTLSPLIAFITQTCSSIPNASPSSQPDHECGSRPMPPIKYHLPLHFPLKPPLPFHIPRLWCSSPRLSSNLFSPHDQ